MALRRVFLETDLEIYLALHEIRTTFSIRRRFIGPINNFESGDKFVMKLVAGGRNGELKISSSGMKMDLSISILLSTRILRMRSRSWKLIFAIELGIIELGRRIGKRDECSLRYFEGREWRREMSSNNSGESSASSLLMIGVFRIRLASHLGSLVSRDDREEREVEEGCHLVFIGGGSAGRTIGRREAA